LEYNGDTNDPPVKKMIKRLQRAMLDENLLHQMMVEDEIEQTLAEKEKQFTGLSHIFTNQNNF
jgi:hypothetical protein